jgi:outer membrane protein assembly factor BamB
MRRGAATAMAGKAKAGPAPEGNRSQMEPKMQGSYVGKVLAAPNGSLAVIGIYDLSSRSYRIQIWNWQTGEMQSEFRTVFDASNRMAISRAGGILIAGNWHAGNNAGVAAYDTNSGSILWHRTDINQTQSLHYSPIDDSVWCSTENDPVQFIDARTGETLFAWETVRDAFDSAYSASRLVNRVTEYVLRGERDIVIPRLNFALFQAEFTPDSVCLIEANGPLRCLDSNTGKERWRYSPEQGHVIRLSYQADGSLYGILFLSKDGEDSKLVRFAPDSGSMEVLYCQDERGPTSWSFGPGVLLTRSGEVVSLETGDVIRNLAIPIHENF